MQTITDERRGKILDTCRQISILLEEIQPGLVPWAVNTGAIDRRFMKELEKIKKQARKFPEEWIELTLAQLATGSVFGNPERIKEYLSLQGSSPGPSLSPDAVRFLESLQDRPAFFTAFGVEKAQGDDLFEVRDYSSNDVHLLLSMALSDTVRSRPESFLTLLFFNGL
ncbi:MAG TPA: hypothetical protein VL354_06090, partial [Spirochaetia bacterium]|nr:hypothetical protein [Spirochaetia bacterium]